MKDVATAHWTRHRWLSHTPLAVDLQPAIAALSAGDFDFIDLGCGNGGSTGHCIRRFASIHATGTEPDAPGTHLRSLGLELNATDAASARDLGYTVVTADVAETTVPDRCVRFVSAMDFLEHLPDADTSCAVLERFAAAANDFVFIRHPSFEDNAYLATLGLKLCWSDWTEHPTMMRLEDYERMFARLGWSDYAIVPRLLLPDSTSDQIVPLSAPTDTMVYDEAAHGPKPHVTFDRPVFTQFDIYIRRDPAMADDVWREIVFSDLDEDAPLWPIRIVTGGVDSRNTLLAVDLGGYDPVTSEWRFREGDGEERTFRYGAAGMDWRPYVGDFDGDGRTGIGLYDRSTGSFFLRNTMDGGDADWTIGFGAPGGLPVVGDWAGKRMATIGVYQPGTAQWFVRHGHEPGPADEEFSFGLAGADRLVVVGDWDGDVRASVGLYEPSTSSWHLRGGSADGKDDVSFYFGPPNGLPVAGDWNGDGRESIGVYMPAWGLWILRDTNSNGPADHVIPYRIDDSRPLVIPT